MNTQHPQRDYSKRTPQPIALAVPKINLLSNQFNTIEESDDIQFVSQSYRDFKKKDNNAGNSHYLTNENYLVNASALQSTRTFNGSRLDNMGPSPLLTGRQQSLNLESTQELKAFATIDLVKINKDRQNQLKLALEDNLREKESQVKEIQLSYKHQRAEYDLINQSLHEKSSELEIEISRQRDHIAYLKKQAASIDAQQQLNETEYSSIQINNIASIDELEGNIQRLQIELRGLESEIQILSYEKQTIEQRIEVRQRVKMQEIDDKVMPLCDEREQIRLNLQLLVQNKNVLKEIRDQNENEITMIEEDLQASSQCKMELIYQREEIEQYIEKTKTDNNDIEFVSSLIPDQNQLDWDQIYKALVFEKQRGLLLDLIRELHQYILGMSSNTTDNSVMQSDELEELQFMIEKRSITIQNAVEIISNFAQTKIRLDLSPSVLADKLNTVNESIDADSIKSSLQELSQLDQTMKDLDQRIKLSLSLKKLNEDLESVSLNIDQLQDTLFQIEQEINQIQLAFDQTQHNFDDKDDQSGLDDKIYQIQDQIKQLEEDIKAIEDEMQSQQERKTEIQRQREEMEERYRENRDKIKESYNKIMEEIRKEKNNALQFEFTNPKIQELTRTVAQLKCDKESGYKRLKYIEAKLANSSESVSHAKQVLDNHILQIQQDQLHLKVNQSSVNFQKRIPSSYHQISTNDQDLNNIGIRRNQNLQQKSISILPGQFLNSGLENFHINVSSRTSQRILEVNKTELIPNRAHHHSSSSVMGFKGENKNLIDDQIRLHSHFIEPDENHNFQKHENQQQKSLGKNHSTISYLDTNTANNQAKVLSQKHRIAIQNYLNDKSVSAADIVKYKYDSSTALSYQEELQSLQESSLQQRNIENASNFNQNLNHKQIPIQTFITPRDRDEASQLYNHSHQSSIVSQNNQYELGFMTNFAHNSSVGSSDSLGASNSIGNIRDFTGYYQNLSTYHQELPTIQSLNIKQNNGPIPQIKISLRQSQNDSLGSSLCSSINFKENIAPNSLSAQSLNNVSLKKLTQPSNTAQLATNKPPAVPQSRISQYSEHSDVSKKHSAFRTKVQETPITSNRQSIQTKMRLCMNCNNGKILSVGVVDLAKCNSSLVQRDIQFFESVKPLIEGQQFLSINRHGQLQSCSIYLDFSLLRMFRTLGDYREIVMVENLVKTELPERTLEMIKEDKTNGFIPENSNRQYEFHIIMNNSKGIAERVQLMTSRYEELRLWIIGLNSLIGNKNNLMRLSSLIKN